MSKPIRHRGFPVARLSQPCYVLITGGTPVPHFEHEQEYEQEHEHEHEHKVHPCPCAPVRPRPSAIFIRS